MYIDYSSSVDLFVFKSFFHKNVTRSLVIKLMEELLLTSSKLTLFIVIFHDLWHFMITNRTFYTDYSRIIRNTHHVISRIIPNTQHQIFIKARVIQLAESISLFICEVFYMFKYYIHFTFFYFGSLVKSDYKTF